MILAASLTGATSSRAGAQVRDTTRADTAVFRLTGISVQASRPVTTVGGTSAIEVLVDSLSLTAAPRLEEVLREIPMIHVRTNSRGEAEITMRGSESRTVAVLVDGVPLTLQWDARTDVSVIPATAVQALTFTRGLSSMLYGPNVLGGVVEVSVAHGDHRPPGPALTVGAGLDHTGGHGTAGTLTLPVGGGTGNWLIRSGVGYRNSPGATLARGIREPEPGDDPALRLNTDNEQADGFFALRFNSESGPWFSLSGSGFRAERGIAAELGSPNPRLWRYPRVERFLTVLSGGTGIGRTPFGGRGDVEASVGIDLGRTEIASYATRAYDAETGFEHGEDRTLTLRLLADHSLGRRSDLRAAFTFADIVHDEILPGLTNEYQQRLWSLGGETIWRLTDGPGMATRLSFGGALDVGDTPRTGDKDPLDRLTDWGARVGLTATQGGGNTLFHAGISRRGRFPSLRELYSGALNRFEPNPDLRAEHLIAFEAGITARPGEADMQAVLFHHRLSDAIVRVRSPNGRFQRVNRDEMRSTGLELMASRAFGVLSLGGDLTWQSVELLDPSSSLTREPENQPSLFGSIRARFPVAAGLRAAAAARFTSRNFCLDLDTGEDTRLNGGTRLDAELSRTWSIRRAAPSWFSSLEARVTVDNALDTAIYDQCGLPQPGRLLRFEVRLF